MNESANKTRMTTAGRERERDRERERKDRERERERNEERMEVNRK